MKALRIGSISCFLVLVFVLTFAFLFKRWSDELWTEQSIAATNLFRPTTSFTEKATLWQRITNAKNIVGCSARTVCTTSSSSPSWFPKTRKKMTSFHNEPKNTSDVCPFYFKFIQQDLSPWAKTGITLEMVEEAKKKASFRIMVINGRLFMESYHHCYQTRDLFTLWGIAQLLKFYPGMVPDLDLMFDCNDKTVIMKNNYHGRPPPVMFHYCGSKDSYDIPFPDWSFWGWPEIQIPPWERLVKEIRNGTQKVKWEDRDPRAFWKGNPWVSPKRGELLKCGSTPNWNAHLYTQDWGKESKKGFTNSKLSDQCDHRYKIYIEGNAWSVSLKYILACDSPTLMITPEYHDFFLRGLVPQQHYWPITPNNKCNSIKFAVNWGNQHPQEAMKIGRAASDLMLNELRMKDVYDYMLHVFRAYGKLLKYKPTVTERSAEYCSETILCVANAAEKDYMETSKVKSSSPSPPCVLGDPLSDSKAVRDFMVRKAESMSNIVRMEEKSA